MSTTKVRYAGGMRFIGQGLSGHEVIMDAGPEGGGEDRAARPVETLLCSLGGCTGMDVVAILRKMKTEPEDLRIEIIDERALEYPKVITTLHLKYIVKGRLPVENVRRAVDLSLAKYCPIANTLAGVSAITSEIVIEAA